MTIFRTLATVRHHGMDLTDYEFTVPLDHDQPSGESLSIFARAVRNSEQSAASRPWLVFLQGGPGFPGPRPLNNIGWLKRALDDYHVLLLDSRGNGRSSVVLPQTLRPTWQCAGASRLSDAFPRRQHRAGCRIDPSPLGWRRRAVERARPELRRVLRGALPVRPSARLARSLHHRRLAAAFRQSPTTITDTRTPRFSARRATSLRATRPIGPCAAVSWSTCIGTRSPCLPAAASPFDAFSRSASCSASTTAWRISTTCSKAPSAPA